MERDRALTLGPHSGLGTWIGARVAPLRCPILRPGDCHCLTPESVVQDRRNFPARVGMITRDWLATDIGMQHSGFSRGFAAPLARAPQTEYKIRMMWLDDVQAAFTLQRQNFDRHIIACSYWSRSGRE